MKRCIYKGFKVCWQAAINNKIKSLLLSQIDYWSKKSFKLCEGSLISPLILPLELEPVLVIGAEGMEVKKKLFKSKNCYSLMDSWWVLWAAFLAQHSSQKILSRFSLLPQKAQKLANTLRVENYYSMMDLWWVSWA